MSVIVNVNQSHSIYYDNLLLLGWAGDEGEEEGEDCEEDEYILV